MKNSILFLCFLFGASCFAQNITNTLAPGGKFIVKDAANNYLTLDQSNGQINVLRNIRLENTTSQNVGIIFKGTDRFIHDYGLDNIFIGAGAGNFTLTGRGNISMGLATLTNNVSGYDNLAIGTYALSTNTDGNENTSVGTLTLALNTSGSRNTAIGEESMNLNTSGNSNTAAGYLSLYSNTTGSLNTAVGTGTLHMNKANNRSTAIGFESMYFADDRISGRETFNTAVGYQSLRGSTTPSNNIGTYNTAIGDETMFSNSFGSYNTANGYQSLYSNTDGYANTASGYQSLYSNTSGHSNTALGWNALYSNTTGQLNTALGLNAYPTVATSNYTGIGYNVGGASSSSNRVEIGNSSVTWIGGAVNWSIYSDERIKENISENVPGLAFISKLRPVTYTLNIHKQNEMMYKGKESQAEWDSKYDIEKIRMTGFIAQEVEKAAQEVNYNFSGVEKSKNEDGLYSLRYSEFVMPLVKAVQELQKKIEELENEIKELKKR